MSFFSGNMKRQAELCQRLSEKTRQTMFDVTKYANEDTHWGGSLSCVEVLSALFSSVLNNRNPALRDEVKDKFLLSKGHAALALYATMYQMGMLSEEQLSCYQKDGSRISELLECNPKLGFEVSGGSLGNGPSYAVGLALLAKRKGYSYKTYVMVGDGELDEGAVWEAIMAASQFQLDNLTLIVDANGMQLDGSTESIMSWEMLETRLHSFGWNTVSVDGHNCEQLLNAFSSNHKENTPFAVIAHTVKGKGISFMENNVIWHDHTLKGEELERARLEVFGHA